MCAHPDPPEPFPRPELFDECRMVHAHGELDLTSVAPLADALEGARSGRGRVFLIVDLREVTFADGSILRPLCEAWDDCRARRGWVRVVHNSVGIDLVLLGGGVLGRFPAYASAQDAWRGTPTAARGAAPAPTSTRTADGAAR
ncbi:anti-anti-sigma factor [Streptomyces sp. TLI_55]|uniref:STAS domain-containing protein n=1 Tax=Streptomyces sp. TLI_55 TaxID=1938861 RepID=UPI000BDACE72|nr:STAS domain-containing protein [Streptomyces sp. TLI_55]SNX62715.1 anti-anti-sigma factor [Streptomyces sp. TLI_55]